MGIGDWGLGIGDWGLGIGANRPSPMPHPQYPNPHTHSPIQNIININNVLIIYI